MDQHEKSPDMTHPVVQAILEAYTKGQEDEALEPIVVLDRENRPSGRMRAGDYVIFYDIRGEREIQLTNSLIERDFDHFAKDPDVILNFVTMIEYSRELQVKVAFPPEGEVRNTIAEVITSAGLKLSKISESEKAVHVGYFMNGKCDACFVGEERHVVPSPEGVASYAAVPKMSASKVTDKIFESLTDDECPLVIANYANVDVVGHIEQREAVIQAVEAVDHELGRVAEYCRKNRITLVITADHGTVEEWIYPDGQINTGHTKNPVPFIVADYSLENPLEVKLKNKGELADVSPTLIKLLGLEIPSEMTAEGLLHPEYRPSPRSKILTIILDGWGMRQAKEGNLILASRTPNFDRLWENSPHAKLDASGESVGMPHGTVGNSESGHLHLGSGRRILLDRVRIDQAGRSGDFARNPAFNWAMDQALKEGKSLHLLGIVSHYSSHGTIDHLFGLLEMAADKGLKDVYVHALVGRRGEKPESGAVYIAKVADKCRELSVGDVVTVIGRYWALDREENWDRIEKTYRALVEGKGTQVCSG